MVYSRILDTKKCEIQLQKNTLIETHSNNVFTSHFYISYSDVNEISYFKGNANCISKRPLNRSLKTAL